MAVQDIEAKSSHVEDASLQPFLQAEFDAADYLNTTLPSLSFSNNNINTTRDAQGQAQATRVSLADLTTRTQSLLSHLNAQTSRLTVTLNHLTDDILRSGTRLAYEVEMLRGETVGLSELLNQGLKEDIACFVPEASTIPPEASSDQPASGVIAEPDYIVRLRTLTHVRARLDSVIQVFGSAMQWPLAPSDLESTSSSLISVTAPSAPDPATSRDLEDKARDHVQRLRSEVQELLRGATNTEEGIEAAQEKIEATRLLAGVWKGTAEEKARIKVVEGLMKVLEDEQRVLTRKTEATRRTASPSAQLGDVSASSTRHGGYGFIKNLQKLKDDIYLD